MVWDLHSEHSQTAGQESAASEEPLTGRMMSVSSAHVIICMLDLRRVAAKYPPNESASPPDRSFWWPQQAVYCRYSQGAQDQRCLFGGKVKVYPQVDAEDLQPHFAAQGRRSVWRWGCCRTDICSPVVGVEVVSNLRRGWILELFKKIIMSFWHGSLLYIIHSIIY